MNVSARVRLSATSGGDVIRAGDHILLRKLHTQVLPWIVAGRRVDSSWFVRLSDFYGYAGDCAAALAGIGVGAPIISVLVRGVKPGQSLFDAFSNVLPQPWAGVGVAAAVVYVIIRTVVQREHVVARALLAREFVREMNSLNVELFAALDVGDPMPTIIEIQRRLDRAVQEAIKNRIWQWEPLPHDAHHFAGLAQATSDVRDKFMCSWASPPDDERIDD